MKYRLLILLMLGVTTLYGQEVRWAKEVLSYSSQFGKRQYGVRQLLGRPNVLPMLGVSPNAWSPKRKKKQEYVHVRFDDPIRIQQIAVVETHRPGGIYQIRAYDRQGNEYLLNTFEPRRIPIEGRLFRFFFQKTDYKVASLKISIDASVLKGHFGIDAIGVSDSRVPITAAINLTDVVGNDYLPEVLGTNINSAYNELRPLLAPEGNTMYFSRQNHPENTGGTRDDEDIWFSRRDSTGQWGLAQNAGRPLNNKGPNFVSSISADGKGMLLLLGNAYYSKNRMTQGLSMSIKQEDGTWSKPENLDIDDDYNLSDKANYFLSNDRRTIIMAIERKDAYGDRDLYAVFMRDDSTWSKPLNLGGEINSAAEESAPFLTADGSTMFFSSKGFSGYGNYDIYLSRRLDDTWQNWSPPENLGAAFNSPEDDIFFNFTEDDEYAYFVRNSGTNTDIYKVRLPYYQRPSTIPPPHQPFEGIVMVSGKVYDAVDSLPVAASLEFIQTHIVLTDADTDGYRIALPEGLQYRIVAKADRYYNTIDSLDLRGIRAPDTVVKDIYLNPVVTDQAIVLNNIYFAFDSDSITPQSFPELNNISEMLLDHPHLSIAINGHTCSLGSEDYNLDLSKRRARSIARYLILTGVPDDMIAFYGHGEARPVLSNKTLQGRRTNRRVEFKLNNKGGIGSVRK